MTTEARRWAHLYDRLDQLLNEHRPDRYTVDEQGGAPWMAEVERLWAAEMTEDDLRAMIAREVMLRSD